MDNDKDKLLMCVICRMNLDALWAREPGTVYGNLLNVQENVGMWEQLGIEGECVAPKMGPMPWRIYWDIPWLPTYCSSH